jgi:LPPG:FO 2-phospho-L-lactate transferase
LKIAALAGGVGGAKLADGLNQMLPAGDLSIIVNTGDDFDHYGLRICPDLDTVCYTLAGMANPETGWGVEGDTFSALSAAAKLGGPDWFRIGDRDLGTHLERTRRTAAGETLSEITAGFCQRWGVSAKVIPMSDERVSTLVHTSEGTLPFQEYFVHRQCQPVVSGFTFENFENTHPAPAALEAIEGADDVVICPSNPWVSIGPILAYDEIRALISRKIVVAVSPIVGGKALRGPAAKMYTEMGWEASAQSVARHYGSILTGFMLDNQDEAAARIIDRSGIISRVSNTIMQTREDRRELARQVLEFAAELDRRLTTG